MRHGSAALVVLFALLFVHPLQQDPPVPQRRVIGLVEIPRLLAPEEPGARPREVAINLFQDPADNAPIVITVRDPELLHTREHDYEELSAVVYQRRGAWFLLRSRARFAWLSPGDAGSFRAYPELLKDRLAYLTRDWDRTVHSAPGGAVTARLATTPSKPVDERDEDFGAVGVDPSDVTVLDVRQHAEEWWVRVRVTPPPCRTTPEPPRIIAEGWVPAYTESGAPTLWYYSRGC